MNPLVYYTGKRSSSKRSFLINNFIYRMINFVNLKKMLKEKESTTFSPWTCSGGWSSCISFPSKSSLSTRTHDLLIVLKGCPEQITLYKTKDNEEMGCRVLQSLQTSFAKFLVWLATKAKESSLLCYLTLSREEKYVRASECNELNRNSNSARLFLVPSS